MNTFDKLALLLVIIVAVNWGCIGLFSLDLVALLFGEMSLMSRIIYSLVGVSGLWCLTLLFRDTEEVHHAVHA